MNGFESFLVTKDEDGEDLHPYMFTRVLECRWDREIIGDRKSNWVLVSNNLPAGFAEAVDISEDLEK
jgi:hypothetical protein